MGASLQLLCLAFLQPSVVVHSLSLYQLDLALKLLLRLLVLLLLLLGPLQYPVRLILQLSEALFYLLAIRVQLGIAHLELRHVVPGLVIVVSQVQLDDGTIPNSQLLSFPGSGLKAVACMGYFGLRLLVALSFL